MYCISDDRMILILAIAFFVGAVWGHWLGHGDGKAGKQSN